MRARSPAPRPSFPFLLQLKISSGERIIGIDEVGRGALAGPLVIAAVELNYFIKGVRDSKQVSSRLERRELADLIRQKSHQLKIVQIDNQQIDRFGLATALKDGYQEVLSGLAADLVLTDNYPLSGTQSFIRSIKGDQLFYPVAAASIVAKVFRDQLMMSYHQFLPHYGWQANVGYGTKAHRQAIDRYGKSSLHRLSFLKRTS